MPKPREPWNIQPAKEQAAVPASLKSEAETKANELIEKTLKPGYVKSSAKDQQFNHVIDIEASGTEDISTSSPPTPAQAQMPLHRHLSISSLGWNLSATASLPFTPCVIPARNGLVFSMPCPWTSA